MLGACIDRLCGVVLCYVQGVWIAILSPVFFVANALLPAACIMLYSTDRIVCRCSLGGCCDDRLTDCIVW